jgi:hypothetical protein
LGGVVGASQRQQVISHVLSPGLTKFKRIEGNEVL